MFASVVGEGDAVKGGGRLDLIGEEPRKEPEQGTLRAQGAFFLTNLKKKHKTIKIGV